MIFRVDLDNFAPAVQRLLGSKLAAVVSRDGRTIVTSADPQKGLIVGALTGKPVSEVRSVLVAAGLEAISGEWNESGELAMDDCDEPPAYIVAVAYKSREAMPGLWVEAFGHSPTQTEVLKAFFDEFETTTTATMMAPPSFCPSIRRRPPRWSLPFADSRSRCYPSFASTGHSSHKATIHRCSGRCGGG